MNGIRRALAAAVVPVLVALPGTATADRERSRDAIGDMWSSPVGTVDYTPAPSHVAGDIVSTRVVHAPRAVWIRIRLRELDTDNNGNFHRIAIKTDRRFRYVEIDALPDHWSGSVRTTGPAGRPVPCAVRHRIDYALNQVRVRVPRRCLGKPAWVRVGVRSTVAGALRVFTDDAHSRGVPSTIALGPRVRHA